MYSHSPCLSCNLPNYSITHDDDGDDVYLRLNADAELKEKRREQKSEELFKKKYPFQPSINTRSMSIERSNSVFNSLYEDSKQRNENYLKQLEKSKLSKEKDLTFNPKINNGLPKRHPFDVSETLYYDGMRNIRRKLTSAPADDQCSFKPKINEKSKKIAQTSNYNVLRRLAPTIDELRVRNEVMSITKAKLDLDGCTFSPKINTSHSYHTNRNPRDTYERLYQQHKANLERNAEIKRMKELNTVRSMHLPPRPKKPNYLPPEDPFERLYRNKKKPAILRDIPPKPTFKPTLLDNRGVAHPIDYLYQKGVEQIRNRNNPKNNNALLGLSH